jgi:hypothetical protein
MTNIACWEPLKSTMINRETRTLTALLSAVAAISSCGRRIGPHRHHAGLGDGRPPVRSASGWPSERSSARCGAFPGRVGGALSLGGLVGIFLALGSSVFLATI